MNLVTCIREHGQQKAKQQHSPSHGHPCALPNTFTLHKGQPSIFVSQPDGHMSATVTQFHRHGDTH